ncbi:17465_t:CDS:2, partial [Racocetra fulgida]
MPILKQFALKIFAIIPHGAAIERLFSSLELIKTKNHNQINPKLHTEIKTKLANQNNQENYSDLVNDNYKIGETKDLFDFSILLSQEVTSIKLSKNEDWT